MNRFPRLAGASAQIGGPATFVVVPRNSPDRERWVADSPLVLEVLLPALTSGAQVNVELVGTCFVRRVFPYSRGTGSTAPHPNGFVVSRIATQRTPEGEHLEVFLKKGADPEKAYNVGDRFIQAILLAVFAQGGTHPGDGLELAVEITGNHIVSATIGEQ